jgi:hypothetical protein
LKIEAYLVGVTRFSLFLNMTLYQFIAMDEMEQIETVWNQSVLVAERKGKTGDYFLYQIDSFYVEIKYLKGTRIIRRFKSFHDTELLAPYLELIDTSKLLK